MNEERQTDVDRIVGAIDCLSGAVDDLTEQLQLLATLFEECTFETNDRRVIRTCDIARGG